jgi:hypothetical protein
VRSLVEAAANALKLVETITNQCDSRVLQLAIAARFLRANGRGAKWWPDPLPQPEP